MTTTATINNLDLVGGDPVLDFLNTLDGRRGETQVDRLRGYDDLVTFEQRVGWLPRDTAVALLVTAQAAPAAAQSTLEAALALRENLYRMFHALATGDMPATTDLDTFNRVLERQCTRQRVEADGRALRWQLQLDAADCSTVLAPVAVAAAQLLTAEQPQRIKECRGNRCGWMFLDTSRNRSRHWCSMKTCGNVAKVRRFRRNRPAHG